MSNKDDFNTNQLVTDRVSDNPALTEAFFNTNPDARRPGKSPSERPAHYKVICISMYTDDLNRLDTMVDELKGRGLTKANRSALIRHALSQVDLDRVPKGI